MAGDGTGRVTSGSGADGGRRHAQSARKRSAGLLLYRRRHPRRAGGAGAADVEVLLVHPGGPFWARRDEGWWTIPKGEVDEGEDELAAALRELHEELGVALAPSAPQPLGEVVQAGGKRVVAWAVESDVDVHALVLGTFEMEWPPRSGRLQTFPEVDRVEWFDLGAARRKLLAGQLPLLERLENLAGAGDATA